MAKRKGKQSAHQHGRSTQQRSAACGPAVQTYFRFTISDAATRTLVQPTAMAMLPGLQHSDGPTIALIQAADRVVAVLNVLPLATGIAETIWDQPGISECAGSAMRRDR